MEQMWTKEARERYELELQRRRAGKAPIPEPAKPAPVVSTNDRDHATVRVNRSLMDELWLEHHAARALLVEIGDALAALGCSMLQDSLARVTKESKAYLLAPIAKQAGLVHRIEAETKRHEDEINIMRRHYESILAHERRLWRERYVTLRGLASMPMQDADGVDVAAEAVQTIASIEARHSLEICKMQDEIARLRRELRRHEREQEDIVDAVFLEGAGVRQAIEEERLLAEEDGESTCPAA